MALKHVQFFRLCNTALHLCSLQMYNQGIPVLLVMLASLSHAVQAAGLSRRETNEVMDTYVREQVEEKGAEEKHM